MKLRLHEQSLRLRLDRPEVERLCAGQRVEAVTDLGPVSWGVRLWSGPQEEVAWEQGWLNITAPSNG